MSDLADSILDALKSAWDAVTSLFTSKPVGSPAASCPLKGKVLTPEQAQQWFDHFKDKRPDIPFNYPVDCCYTRAREMDKEMQAAGVPCGKVWNYASPGNALTVPTKNVPASPPYNGQVKWGYHVAPIVPVTQPDGSVQNMVIDPSMESGPVSVDKWKADQNDPNSTSATTGPDPYYRDPSGKEMPDPGDASVKQTLDDHRAAKAALGP